MSISVVDTQSQIAIKQINDPSLNKSDSKGLAGFELCGQIHIGYSFGRKEISGHRVYGLRLCVSECLLGRH